LIEALKQRDREAEAYWAKLAARLAPEDRRALDRAQAETLWPNRFARRPTKTKKARRQTLRRQMLQAILRQRYPDGVPKTVTTADVRLQVAGAWSQECQERGLKLSEPPSWDTINRELGRSRH
jgi:hypothetical protein